MRESILKKLQDHDRTEEQRQPGPVPKEKTEAKAKRRPEKHKKAVPSHTGKNSRRAVHFREEQAPK